MKSLKDKVALIKLTPGICAWNRDEERVLVNYLLQGDKVKHYPQKCSPLEGSYELSVW